MARSVVVVFFFAKGKFSNCDFVHIGEALTPRRYGAFLLSHLLSKVNYLPKAPPYFKI